MLLQRQLGFRDRNRNGCTPLWVASVKGHEAVVRLLEEDKDSMVRKTAAATLCAFTPGTLKAMLQHASTRVVVAAVQALSDVPPEVLEQHGLQVVGEDVRDAEEQVAEAAEHLQHAHPPQEVGHVRARPRHPGRRGAGARGRSAPSMVCCRPPG